METRNIQKELEALLAELSLEQAKAILADLQDESLRGPQLYNAITALLKHHKIEVDPVAAARPDHPLGALRHGLPPTFEADEEKFH